MTPPKNFKPTSCNTVKAFVFKDVAGRIFSRADLQLQSDLSDDGAKTPHLVNEDLSERMSDYVAEKYFWLPWGKFFRRDFLLENKIDFPQINFSEDMIFCFKCLCLAKKYLRVPNITHIHRIIGNSISKKNYSLKTWLDVTTKIVADANEFMSGLNFFHQNPTVHRDVLKFFIDKHFSFYRNAFQNVPTHELQKKFYDELNNPALNPTGKQIVTAHLYAERALTK